MVGEGIGAREVIITGVEHSPKSFEMYKGEIEETIKKSSIVMVEGFSRKNMPEVIAADFPRSEHIAEFREELRLLREKGVEIPTEDKVTDEMVRRELTLYRDKENNDLHQGQIFFDKITRLAALHKKPIVFSDPLHSVVDRANQNNTTPEQSEKDLQKSMVYGGIIAAAAATLAAQLTPRSKNAPINRRSFLGMAGAGIATAAAGGLSQIANKLEKDVIKAGGHLSRETNPLGPLRYSAMDDYRDAAVGIAVDRVADLTKDSRQPIAVFFGRSHIDSIRHYAEAPIEARIKLRTYQQEINYAEPSLFIYDYDDSKNQWALRSKESLLKV